MNPLSLKAHGYRTFHELELDLPSGCVAVVGENGFGKSSIVEAVELALYGKCRKGPAGALSEQLSKDDSSTDLEIEMTFEHGGDLYRVRRSYSARGRGKSATDFERRNGEGWEPLTRESQKATQELIEETIGLSRRTFRASAFLAQDDGGAFTEADAKDRKEILAEILALGVWPTMNDLVRADARAAGREAEQLAGRIELLEEQGGDVEALGAHVKAVRIAGQMVEHDHANAEQALTAAAERVAELDRAESTYNVRRTALGAAKARLAERRAVIDRAAAAKLEAVATQRELDENTAETRPIEELEKQRAAMLEEGMLVKDRERERDDLLRQAAQAEQERDGMKLEAQRAILAYETARGKVAELQEAGNVHRCDRCEQEIHGEAFQKTFDSLVAERDQAQRRRDEISERILALVRREEELNEQAKAVVIPEVPAGRDKVFADLVREIEAARSIELDSARLRATLAGLQRTIDEVTPELTAEVVRLSEEVVDAQEALAAIEEPEPGALDSARAKALEVSVRRDELARQLTESRAALVRAETALENAQKIAEELTTARGHREELLGELDLLVLLERAYGRDGIPALIVESSAIPSIETEANRILAELGTSYRVELRTQRALKDGGLSDALDVVVIGDAGERPYETFSGGERTRINLALRIALARLLAHRRGADVRCLFVDEPEFLDEAGTARLAEVLRGLESEFERIVLVSHVPTLRDAFDQTIEIVKDGNRSVVVA